MIDSRTWWITGGFSGEQIYNSTEVYEPGVGFRAGPKMPAVTFQHCIVKVNATHVFSAGGYPYNRSQKYSMPCHGKHSSKTMHVFQT